MATFSLLNSVAVCMSVCFAIACVYVGHVVLCSFCLCRYVRTGTVQGEAHGIMFLCEAAMGKTKEITRDDSSLVRAPEGYDSIIAKGTQARTVDSLNILQRGQGLMLASLLYPSI